jgi:hypothetical protein
MSGDSITVDGFVVVEATEYSITDKVLKAKYAKVTNRMPQLTGDQRAVRVRLTLPTSVFDPVATVRVTIPEGDVIYPDVVVG